MDIADVLVYCPTDRQVRTMVFEYQKDQMDSPMILSGYLAARQAVLKAIPEADILHYCGHAFFDGPGPDQSGLVLHDGDLTIQQLRQLGEFPRIAFMNACEAARVRGAPAYKPTAFAELFLRSGIEDYLGTFWRVGDLAASEFAKEIYTQLAQGQTLDTAVRKARHHLHTTQTPDWANYILYGDGRLQLVKASC